MSTSTPHTLYVSGTHCSACKHLIEETLMEQPDIEHPVVSLREETVSFATTRTDSPAVLAAHLTALLGEHGYRVHVERPVKAHSVREWAFALLAVLLAVCGYVLLGRTGLTALIGSSEATLTTALVVGFVASLSTCLAVVGGLVLSVSATYAHEGKGWRPQVLFHAGRIVGFFILGGLLGMLGKVVQIGVYGSAALGALASVVMLVLGIHLLDVTTRVRTLTLPPAISASFTTVARRAGSCAPFMLGAITFFLPCGFTQSMQVIALSSGTFLSGANTMLAFSLGTLPVLALLSFGTVDLAKTKYRGTFFKAVGMLVILFALFNLQNALVLFGIISPVIGF